MSLAGITPGKDAPSVFNVVIEIPMRSDPVKYEVDKETGALFVDRILNTAMHYPTNYGYVPQTLAEDGDPVDVLVMTPFPLFSGSVVKCRPLGVLIMRDEAGEDQKVLAVPVDKVSGGIYLNVRSIADLPEIVLKQISHFFERYKDLEVGKWVKVDGWQDIAAAEKEIAAGMKRYTK